jgi:pimeloyl-ACP methyl ester carboxylesterase/uncharacterized membrane protein HdeD (DUF308 family)
MSKFLYIRQDIGSGDPIVLLHGMFGDGTQWKKIAEKLSNQYRVIVVDLLGHGRSPRPKDCEYTPEDHTQALRLTLEKLNATDNLTVVGYSMGGAVALSYCASFPSKQLFLISTPFYLNTNQMILANFAPSVTITKISTFIFKQVELSISNQGVVNRAVRYGDKSKKFHKMIGANDNKLDSEIIRKNLKQLVREFNFAKYLSKVKTPTTFYAGKKDLFIVQGQLYALKKFNPYMDIQRLEVIKVDHMLVQNLPKEISSLLIINKEDKLKINNDSGKGVPLILLHGIESSSNYWHNLVPALSENHRVITIDLLGFGNSPKPQNIAYSIDDHIEWLDRTIKSLGLKEFILAGHSLGSIISLAYASKHPKKVKELFLFSPVLIGYQAKSSRKVINGLSLLKGLNDTSYVHAQLAQNIGDKNVAKFLPALRTIENTINKQDSIKISKQVTTVPVHFYFGSADQLIDKQYVESVANEFDVSEVHELKNRNHNFLLFSPEIVVDAIDKGYKPKSEISKFSVLPPNFRKHITNLAVPRVFLKSIFLFCVAILLFTDLAPAVLVLFLSVYILLNGYKTIKGVFSLKNEELSYLGYLFLGIVTYIIAFGLIRRPELSLKIAVIVICSGVLVGGINRVIVARFWTESPKIKKLLYYSGWPMIILGLLAIFGITKSVYIIVYTFALYLFLKSIKFFWIGFAGLIMAYIRGFIR